MTEWENNVRQWATDRNIIGGTEPKDQMLKLVEELGELSSAMQKKDLFLISDGIGDCAVVLCILAAQFGMSFTSCQNAAWDEIKHRRGRIINGVFVREAT